MVKSMMIAALGAGLLAGCVSDEFEQVDLGELPTPVYIRAVLWDVRGCCLADGRTDPSMFGRVLADSRADFAVLRNIGPQQAESVAKAAGLKHVSAANGLAVVSRVPPEEVKTEEYKTSGAGFMSASLFVEQSDFCINVSEFTSAVDVKTAEEVKLAFWGRGKVQFLCTEYAWKAGTAAADCFDGKFRKVGTGLAVGRDWGAGGFSLAEEKSVGGAVFPRPGRLVVIKD